MNGFIAVAGLLTLAALVVVLYPLLRRKEGSPEAWRSGGLVALLIALGAAALYPLWSNYNWQQPAQALDSPEAMVGRLARRLEKEPDDLKGWLQLGRSYLVLQQYELSVRAYGRAYALAKGQGSEVTQDVAKQLMDLSEGLFDAGFSDLAGRSGQLFEQAMELDPNSTKALFYSALAASERNELPLAKQRFQRLLDANPPANVRALIQDYMKQLDVTSVMSAAPSAPAAASAATPAAGVVTVPLRVTLSGKVSGKALPSDARLFVMARIPGQGGPPVAVQLLQANFPQEVELRNTDSVMGGSGFKAGQELEIEARIALRGGANSQSGDPFGTVRLKAGAGARTTLEINQFKP